MYRILLFAHGRWHTAALAPTLETGEEWALKQLRPNGPAERYVIRPAREADIAAYREGLYTTTPDGITIWWETAQGVRS